MISAWRGQASERAYECNDMGPGMAPDGDWRESGDDEEWLMKIDKDWHFHPTIRLQWAEHSANNTSIPDKSDKMRDYNFFVKSFLGERELPKNCVLRFLKEMYNTKEILGMGQITLSNWLCSVRTDSSFGNLRQKASIDYFKYLVLIEASVSAGASAEPSANFGNIVKEFQ